MVAVVLVAAVVIADSQIHSMGDLLHQRLNPLLTARHVPSTVAIVT